MVHLFTLILNPVFIGTKAFTTLEHVNLVIIIGKSSLKISPTQKRWSRGGCCRDSLPLQPSLVLLLGPSLLGLWQFKGLLPFSFEDVLGVLELLAAVCVYLCALDGILLICTITWFARSWLRASKFSLSWKRCLPWRHVDSLLIHLEWLQHAKAQLAWSWKLTHLGLRCLIKACICHTLIGWKLLCCVSIGLVHYSGANSLFLLVVWYLEWDLGWFYFSC